MPVKSSKDKAFRLVSMALEKKADNPVVLEVGGLSNFCDYFVICSGHSAVHVRAIFEGIVRLAKKEEFGTFHREDDKTSEWLLIDFFDVVMHIFSEEKRRYYDLEHLWREAEIISPG